MSHEVNEATAPVPMLHLAGGTPPIIDTELELSAAITQLAQGSGAFAVDAERASGYKYSARAYLIQIKRTGGGLHLIDPISFGPGHHLFQQLSELLQSDEVILHASTQDLPCLRELGITPSLLFDTELGGRLAGLPRVGLGALVESLLNISLAKEHSAVDWSTRPLPQSWLDYAALDVELLVELREKIYTLLQQAGKWEWASEEFASIIAAPPPPARVDPWRRTSGAHKVKHRSQLAVMRALWNIRNEIAQEADISPSRLLSDAAIVALALASSIQPLLNRKHLEKALRPIGLRARWFENSATWISAITDAIALPEDTWPQARAKTDTLPPVKLWRERFPDRYAPLTHARATLEILALELSIPLENLISPEAIRRICWSPPPGATQSVDLEGVTQALLALGARSWQVRLIAPPLARALLEKEPLLIPEVVLGEGAEGGAQ